MGFVTTDDDVQIFYKDWGPKDSQPIVFHHGWPLSSDDWDAQMLFFLSKGYRVVAHDRRGHGRSGQVADGHDIDHYAADAFAVARALDLKNAVHIGHSTGGGEVARYVARHGEPAGRVAKAVLVSAIPPLMLKTDDNPEGTPMEVFDGFRTALASNRAQFFRDVPSGPFYGFNREGATVHEGVIQNWWRQGMMGSAKAHYDGIKAFSETDQTQDLKAITVPTLVLHGEADTCNAPETSAGREALFSGPYHRQLLPGVGHFPQREAPQAVAEAILQFCQGIEPLLDAAGGET